MSSVTTKKLSFNLNNTSLNFKFFTITRSNFRIQYLPSEVLLFVLSFADETRVPKFLFQNYELRKSRFIIHCSAQ